MDQVAMIAPAPTKAASGAGQVYFPRIEVPDGCMTALAFRGQEEPCWLLLDEECTSQAFDRIDRIYDSLGVYPPRDRLNGWLRDQRAILVLLNAWAGDGDELTMGAVGLLIPVQAEGCRAVRINLDVLASISPDTVDALAHLAELIAGQGPKTACQEVAISVTSAMPCPAGYLRTGDGSRSVMTKHLGMN